MEAREMGRGEVIPCFMKNRPICGVERFCGEWRGGEESVVVLEWCCRGEGVELDGSEQQ